MCYRQSVDPLSITDERIGENETREESESGDDGNKFVSAESESDTDEAKFDSSKTARSEEIVVVSVKSLDILLLLVTTPIFRYLKFI